MGWTPPLLGFWPLHGTVLEDYVGLSSDISMSNGTLTTKSGDANILRNNGKAIKVIASVGAQRVGVNGTGLSLPNTNGNASISIFFQFRCPLVITTGSDDLELFRLNDANSHIKFILRDNISGANDLTVEINNNGSTAEVQKSDATLLEPLIDTWYDVCFTYDSVNNKVAVYMIASPTTSTFTKFLDGLTNQEDQIMESLSASFFPPATTWRTLQLLVADTNAISSNIMYMQNPMIMDEWISPYQFNEIRRINHLWSQRVASTGIKPD